MAWGWTSRWRQLPAAADHAPFLWTRIKAKLGTMTLSLEDLYPDATDEERAEARRRLAAYLRVVLEIVDDERRRSFDEPQDEA